MATLAPIMTLREAHDVGIEKLRTLSGAASSLQETQDPSALETLKELFPFFDGELRVHFRHEEEALFPALEMLIGREGPIMVMLDEHKSLWLVVDALREKTEQIEAASGEERERIAHELALVAQHIVGLLGSHIEKENSVLFPIAERGLSARAMSQLAESMSEIR